MKLPFSEPDPAGSERARLAKAQRDLATEIARLAPQARSEGNGEENDHGPVYPANFTKGLRHDDCGLLLNDEDYRCFVEAINSPDRTLFEKRVATTVDYFEAEVEKAEHKGETPPASPFDCGRKTPICNDKTVFDWRGWESPRAGHVYELQGPDAGAVGMAPAPRIGSSELAAEMAEVYALAILRDVPFTVICDGGGQRLCPSVEEPGEAQLDADQIVNLLNDMPFFSLDEVRSSTPHMVDETGLNAFERARRFGRTLSPNGPITLQNVFRGSTKGAQMGPYISQFMLIGADSIAGPTNGNASYPARDAAFDLPDGYIPYGSLIVDQRTLSHKNCLDYMTTWCSWRDVQNGANTVGIDQFEDNRRFITTPRDLATYVHYDALYEAYLNACLVLLAMRVPDSDGCLMPLPFSKGFPEKNARGSRTGFATFGGPHILSLVCEVATRCLKAVRRQKFNYHRRARPEALGGRFTLAQLGLGDKLGCSAEAFAAALAEIPEDLKQAVIDHNAEQNGDAMAAMRNIVCPDDGTLPTDIDAATFAAGNLLLPMAFPEGSPMHPAYGAGHATVAGGCVTMLKAFFEMFEDCDSFTERKLLDRNGDPIAYVPNAQGNRLIKYTKTDDVLTIQGELDKLAANISIGRNMAGVHYYSDYYDSLRMGERIAIGILLEQAPSYGETVSMSLKSFDGDYVTISGEGGSCPSMAIMDRRGNPVNPHDWWLRHVIGAEVAEDLFLRPG